MPHGEYFEIGLRELLVQRPELEEATLRTRGTTFNDFLHAAAAMAEEVEYEGAEADAAGFLDTARGDRLTRWCASERDVARHGATASIVSLTFSRTDDADEASVPAGTVCSALVNGVRVRFTSDYEVAWSAGDVSDKIVLGTSVKTGPENNVPAGTVTTIEATLTDSTITVTNAEPSAGGNIAESDEDLIARVRDLAARQVRGTVSAIGLGAREVESVREASVFESVDPNGDPTGGVTVVISDSDGYSNEALADAVDLELYEWRPAGCRVATSGATIVLQDIEITAVWKPGQATPANKSLLKAALRARVNRLDPRAAPADQEPEDSCLLTHAVIQEVRPLVPGLVRISQITTPAGTVEPDPGEVIRAGNIEVD